MTMDARFRSDQEWYISPLIDLSDFLNQSSSANNLLRAMIKFPTEQLECYVKNENGDVEEQDQELARILTSISNCHSNTARRIFEQDLSIDLLRGDRGVNEMGESTTIYEETNGLDKVPSTCVLKTIKNAIKRNEQALNPQRKNNYMNDGKYYRYKYDVPLERSFLENIHTRCEHDLVMTCSLAYPNNKIVSGEGSKSAYLKPAVKLLVRGETTLLNFRKRIMCPCDMAIDVTRGEWLEKPNIEKSYGNIYPSSFLFIHDTFYVDTTRAGATDITEPIREFMDKYKSTFGPCHVKSIEGLKIKDLKLRLGQPYLFQHCGECEHLLTFHDLRLLGPQDEQNIDKYPLVAFEKGGDTKCCACRKLHAGMMVEDCELLPCSPAFMCEGCFKEFLFNADNTPVCQFVASYYYSFTKLY